MDMRKSIHEKKRAVECVLEIMKDNKKWNPSNLVKEMKKRFDIEIGRSTLYGYFNPMIEANKMTRVFKKSPKCRGRKKAYFQLAQKNN